MGKLLHEESPRYARMRFDEEKVAALARGVICGERGGALVALRGETIIGMLFGYVAESWFGPDLVAGDFTFYVLPERRGGRAALLLIDAFERWAKAAGATECVLGVSTMINPERTARFFARSGFVPTGATLTKRLL
jgi:GNAT superfamily N-acetyltransferase